MRFAIKLVIKIILTLLGAIWMLSSFWLILIIALLIAASRYATSEKPFKECWLEGWEFAAEPVVDVFKIWRKNG